MHRADHQVGEALLEPVGSRIITQAVKVQNAQPLNGNVRLLSGSRRSER
jgi:hypothetical protein